MPVKTETSHTPGPWAVGTVDKPYDIFGLPNTTIDMPGNARVYVLGEQQDANACLIAAAPAMLECLQLVLRDREAGCLRQDTCQHIETVINKALGK